MGDVEEKIPDTALIGDGEDSDDSEKDEFGFEFV